jgi:signal transduction histidine kinase
MSQRLQALRGRRVRGLPLPDVALAVGLLAASLAEWWLAEPFPWNRPADPAGFVLLAAASGALAWRRTSPVRAFVVVLVCDSLTTLASYPGSTAANAVLVTLYSVGAHVGRLQVAWAAGVAASALFVTGWLDDAVFARYPFEWPAYVGIVLFTCVPAFAGDRVRVVRGQRAQALAEALHRERTQRIDAELALEQERARIAEELQNVVALHVSGIVLQAGAPGPADEALHGIRASGVAALAAMHDLVGGLRSDDGARDAP